MGRKIHETSTLQAQTYIYPTLSDKINKHEYKQAILLQTAHIDK